MSKRSIVIEPDPILRKKSDFSNSIRDGFTIWYPVFNIKSQKIENIETSFAAKLGKVSLNPSGSKKLFTILSKLIKRPI